METHNGHFLEIDGSHGEGGGQIFRTGLAFSAFLKRPLKIYNIRRDRKNPGLQPQHLRAAEALATLTGARTEGLRAGSGSITFAPQKMIPGDYRFEIGTAGSVTLLLQALLLPLAIGHGSFRLTLVGGTHVPWSPPFHYLNEVLLPALRLMGVAARATLEQWGWYPRGGGVVHLEIEPNPHLRPLLFAERGPLRSIRGLSSISHLPGHVAERQRDYALRRIEEDLKRSAEIDILYDAPGIGQGSFIFLVAESENGIAGFSSLGQRGKPAEQVAKEAVDSLEAYLKTGGSLDPYLADQLVPFLALAEGNSSFTTARVTEHLLTNLWVVERFIDVKVSVRGEKGREGEIRITPSREDLHIVET